MKIGTLILLAFLYINTALSQNSDYVRLVVLIQNDSKKPQSFLSFTIEGTKGEKPQTFMTDAKGKAKCVLPINDTYTISFEDAPKHTVVKIPKGSRFLVTKRIIYNGKTEPTTVQKMDTIIQNLGRAATSTDNDLLCIINLVSLKKKPHPNVQIWVEHKKYNRMYYAKTDKDGQAKFSLPRGQTFQIHLADAPNFKTLRMSNTPKMTKKVTYRYVSNTLTINERVSNDTIYQEVPLTQQATRLRVRVHVTVLDLDENPLENEKVYMITNKGKVYTATTDKKGIAILMIPKGNSVSVGFEYDSNIETITYQKGNYIRNDKIQFRYIGSKAIEERIAARLKAMKVRDSLYKVGAISYGISRDLRVYNVEEIAKLITKRAEYERNELKKDADFFIKRKEAVKAVLQRKMGDWQNKIIVTDATGSMSPHWDEVLIWHALQLAADNRTGYVFFNDGNRKTTKEKVIGSTGGIYKTDKGEMNAILKIMKTTITSGGGGDGPENDIEALLQAQKMRKNNEEIILIADNYSDVRDMKLLVDLKVPIRIILAGAKETMGVNEQYLELALKTGGSVHTLREDISNLARLADGESIIIGKFEYKMMRGKFIQVKKL